MDPNEALQDIRNGLANYFANGIDVDLDHIFDRVEALDEWLSRGGFLPDAWQR
ncbi:hypothetical protein MINTMi198_17570 [Mycobacterium intracellulare M.i.198]|nr:hypothetical protein MINTMi198_17570 [Mycobacterium intracellulare M.i.198]